MHYNSLDELLNDLPALAQRHQEDLAGRTALFLFESKQGRKAYIALENGEVTVSDTCPNTPDATISADEGDLMDMISGKLNPMAALMLGKVSVKGNMKSLMDLMALLK